MPELRGVATHGGHPALKMSHDRPDLIGSKPIASLWLDDGREIKAAGPIGGALSAQRCLAPSHYDRLMIIAEFFFVCHHISPTSSVRSMLVLRPTQLENIRYLTPHHSQMIQIEVLCSQEVGQYQFRQTIIKLTVEQEV